MPSRHAGLFLLTRKGRLSIPGRGTLLARCTAAGVPLASSCSGRGACGKCVVRVVTGHAALSRMTEREALVLEKNRASPGERLSCMCRVVERTAEVVVSTGYW